MYKPPTVKPDMRVYDIEGNLIEAAEEEEEEEEDVEIVDEENGGFFDDFLKGLNEGGEEEAQEEYYDDEEEEAYEEQEQEQQPTESMYFLLHVLLTSIDKSTPKGHSIRREVQQRIDDEFDKLLEQYTDDQIGELDSEEAQGKLKIRDIQSVVEQFLDSTKTKFDSQLITDYYDAGDLNEPTDSEQLPEGRYLFTNDDRIFGRNDVSRDEILDIIKKRLEVARERRKQQNRESDDESDEEYEEIEVPQEMKWDCESIISTYSNIENHPKLIIDKKKVKLSNKTGIPLGVLEEKKPKTEEEEEADEQDLAENMGAARIKDETQDEKKERKKFVKMYKKMMREQKKSLKTAFKTEEQRQGKLFAQPHARQKVVVKY
jgi:protein LTV1